MVCVSNIPNHQTPIPVIFNICYNIWDTYTIMVSQSSPGALERHPTALRQICHCMEHRGDGSGAKIWGTHSLKGEIRRVKWDILELQRDLMGCNRI